MAHGEGAGEDRGDRPLERAADLRQHDRGHGAWRRAGFGACRFFGRYERADFAGLVEMDRRYLVSPEIVDNWDWALASYHHAADKEAFLSAAGADEAAVINTRYSEWLEITHWTDGLALAGREVLNVGAGLGVGCIWACLGRGPWVKH